MLEALKNIFRTSKPQQEQHFHRPIRARSDAAQTTRVNAKHWAYADQLSADMEASPEVRRTLRMRSRYEVANNSYARGLVQLQNIHLEVLLFELGSRYRIPQVFIFDVRQR